jgi:hypothetical protein
MRVLDFGDWQVAVSLDTCHNAALDQLLDRAADSGPDVFGDLTLHVASDTHPRLVFDVAGRHVTMTVPVEGLSGGTADSTTAIAVLQAAARCLALVRPAECALLHGGAVVSADGAAVAVLDGGRGQGKTSLALALGLSGGRLLADEFLFTTAVDESVVTEPAKRLPWHIRHDMAPYLLSERLDSRLAFPDDLGASSPTAEEPTVIDVVLLPDMTLPAGDVRRVPRDSAAELLRPAMNDHRAKLLNPALDHVSLFHSADQLATTDGFPLAATAGGPGGVAEQVHALLAELPVYLVGIGRPSDIMTSAKAVRHALEST